MNPILSQLADNPALLDAVRAFVLDQFNIPTIDPALSNEQLGAIVRANIGGAATVELAFRDIARLKTEPSKKEEPNPAR